VGDAPDPLGGSGRGLTAIHVQQVHRDDWPDFDAFEVSRYSLGLRVRAARQWIRRAREELGSVYEFTAVGHALAEARVPIEILGGISRLVTDEVRHAELCGRMAHVTWPEAAPGDLDFTRPSMPFPEPPSCKDAPSEVEPLLRWAADAILCSCCIGETLSRPLFEAVATVCTDPVGEAVIRQILRDEHLHATFGWETFAELWPRLTDESRSWLGERLSRRLAAFERGAASGVSLEDLAGTEITIEPGDPAEPNLALLTKEQYATIFYATLEHEILPRFEQIGLDARGAWARRSQK